MTRVLNAAAFLRHNMPFGTTFAAPLLSDADAYDVAAYINSLDRPTRANLEKDFPIKMQKPVDAPYGPYVDDFPAEQHKFGPFGPIRAKLRELAAAKKASYVESYGRPGAAEGWHFLTGEQESIDRLTSAVGFRYSYDTKHDQFAHPSGVMVLTPDELRAYLRRAHGLIAAALPRKRQAELGLSAAVAAPRGL